MRFLGKGILEIVQNKTNYKYIDSYENWSMKVAFDSYKRYVLLIKQTINWQSTIKLK